MRPRVLVPLLLALAAALGLVVGAVLPGSPSAPTADSSTPAPADPTDGGSPESPSAEPLPTDSSASPAIGEVMGEGGGVAHQADRFAGNAQADGDFGAQRHKVEIIGESLAAQQGLFMAAVEAHVLAQ